MTKAHRSHHHHHRVCSVMVSHTPGIACVKSLRMAGCGDDDSANCYLAASGSIPCTSFTAVACSELIHVISNIGCQFHNGTMDPTACAGCCANNLTAWPSSPPAVPPLADAPSSTAVIALASAGSVVGLAAVLLTARWFHIRRRSSRRQQVQLDEAFNFGAHTYATPLTPQRSRAPSAVISTPTSSTC